MHDKFPIPNVLWIAIISLAVFSVVHLILGFSRPIQFIALVINLMLIFGLLRLAKWAYFISIFASVIGPFILLYEGIVYYYFILLLNLSVLIPVLICTKSFFTKRTKQPITA